MEKNNEISIENSSNNIKAPKIKNKTLDLSLLIRQQNIDSPNNYSRNFHNSSSINTFNNHDSDISLVNLQSINSRPILSMLESTRSELAHNFNGYSINQISIASSESMINSNDSLFVGEGLENNSNDSNYNSSILNLLPLKFKLISKNESKTKWRDMITKNNKTSLFKYNNFDYNYFIRDFNSSISDYKYNLFEFTTKENKTILR